jgi:hypothetical protein
MRGSHDCHPTDQSFHTIYTLAADRTRCDAKNIDYKALTGATGICPLSSRGKPKIQAGPRKMQEENNTRFTNPRFWPSPSSIFSSHVDIRVIQST